ncbi:MAG: precorrin-3B C(17)-methyltransferase [Nitrospiraceae bacterium]|nr:precorrin-3B C(17)-methyltransferase [Nitrospiraceae bacterium]
MNTENSISIFYITDNGRALAERLTEFYPNAGVKRFNKQTICDEWLPGRAFVCIMAAGIVLRSIALLIKDKKTDPSVIVLDEKGEYAISLLGGHLAGANQMAEEIAGFLGGAPVITTASDVNELPAVDLWARDNGLTVENGDLLARVGTRLVNKGSLLIFSEEDLPLPEAFIEVDKADSANMIVTSRKLVDGRSLRQAVYLRPQTLVLGIGCNRGTSAEEIEEVVMKTLDRNNLAFLSVCSLATIDIKAAEPGLRAFADKYHLPVAIFSADELNTVKGISISEAALRATGAKAVAEPSAILASGGGDLIVSKQKKGNVAVAVAGKKDAPADKRNGLATSSRGKVCVVGTGPGSIDHITPYAQKCIRDADAIVGYGTYLDLIRELTKDKEVISTGMTQEIDRCRKAIELAAEGKNVAVVSGGDPGVYAMAGLVLELLKTSAEDASTKQRPLGTMPSVEIVPGISALNACASRLGAPLMHDFAAISLSDRLTPWETIEKRLDAAAAADFVIALYNPKSRGRAGHIGRAREIILGHRPPETPVGIVKAAMRENETIVIIDLEQMLNHDIDMQSTVIIGNSKSFVWNGLLITPRGYEKKKQYTQKG